jgi:hypothetical protein
MLTKNLPVSLSKGAIHDSRYGSRGKAVFEENLESFLTAETLIKSVSDEGTSDLLGLQLKKALKEVPY